MTWLGAQTRFNVHVSVVTLAEIEEGIARLSKSRRQSDLKAWRDTLIDTLGDRLIGMNAGIAATWTALRAHLAAQRQSIAPLDAFIVATAEHHGFALVTETERHFLRWGGPMINPWVAP